MSESEAEPKSPNKKRGTGNSKKTLKMRKNSRAKNRRKKKQSPEVITISDSDSDAGSVWFSDDDRLRIRSVRRISDAKFGETGYNIMTHLVSQNWKLETATVELCPDTPEAVSIVITKFLAY